MSGILCVRRSDGGSVDREPTVDALRLLRHRGVLEDTREGRGLFLATCTAPDRVRAAVLGRRPATAAVEDRSTDDPVESIATARGPVFVAVDGRVRDVRGGEELEASQVVLRAYLEHGENAFDHLRGAFAAIVWDEREDRLLLARDALGIRPLYYAEGPHRFLAASEIKSLLRLDPALREMNAPRARSLVRDNTIDDWTETCFARIRPVPPGSVMTVNGRGVRTSRYWSLHPVTDPTMTPEIVREMLAEAVARATPADVPVGLALSGGIDSSAIAGLLLDPSDGRARDIRAFSVRPPDTIDESFLIDATIRRTGLPHTYTSLEGVQPAASIERLIDAHDEPIIHSGTLYQFLLRETMASAGCRAVLVGYGADEIFGGYGHLAPSYLVSLAGAGRWGDVIRFSRGGTELLGRSPAGILREAAQWAGRHVRDRMTGGVKLALGPDPATAWRRSGTPGDSVLARTEPARGNGSSSEPPWYALDRVDGGRVFLRTLAACLRKNVPMLARVEDRNAAAHGLELCAPFMDRDVVDRAFQLPFATFMQGGRNKAVLRDASAPLLAPEVVGYPKKLPTPGNDAHLVFGPLSSELRDLLESSSFRQSGLWSDQCARMYAEDFSGRRRGSLWFRVYMVQKWYDRMARPKGFEPSS